MLSPATQLRKPTTSKLTGFQFLNSVPVRFSKDGSFIYTKYVRLLFLLGLLVSLIPVAVMPTLSILLYENLNIFVAIR